MPSFVGQPLGTVSGTLQDSGFRLGNVSVVAPAAPADAGASIVEIPAEASPASIVVSQAPAAGQKVVAGTAVSFDVR